MVYGRLFKKLMKAYPKYNDFSANRFSQLSHKELKDIAKTLYHDGYVERLPKYQNMRHDVLAASIYRTVADM